MFSKQGAATCEATIVVKEVYYNLEYAPFKDARSGENGYRITNAHADFVLKDKIQVAGDFCENPQTPKNTALPGSKAADTPTPKPVVVADTADSCQCQEIPAS